MARYPVEMERWDKVYRQHARLDTTVLKTAADLPMGRFGMIAYAKRHPSLMDAVRDTAEEQAGRVKYAEKFPEHGKMLYWIERWPLSIDKVYEDGSDAVRAYRVSIHGLALWITEQEAASFKRGDWPWGSNRISQRLDKHWATTGLDYFATPTEAFA